MEVVEHIVVQQKSIYHIKEQLFPQKIKRRDKSNMQLAFHWQKYNPKLVDSFSPVYCFPMKPTPGSLHRETFI